MPPNVGKVEKFLHEVFGSINMPEPHKSYWAHLLSRPLFWLVIILIGLGTLFNDFPSLRNYIPFAQETSVAPSATTTSVTAISSNVVVGSPSGSVNQSLTINPEPPPLFQVDVVSTSTDPITGLYKSNLILTLGVVPGATTTLTTFITPLGVNCGPYTFLHSGLMGIGPLVGRIGYSWSVDCISKKQITEYDPAGFAGKYPK